MSDTVMGDGPGVIADGPPLFFPTDLYFGQARYTRLVLKSTTGLRRPVRLTPMMQGLLGFLDDVPYDYAAGNEVGDQGCGPDGTGHRRDDPWLHPDPIDRRPWWVRILNRIGVTI